MARREIEPDGGGGGGARPRPGPSPLPDPVNPNPPVTGTEDLQQLLAAEIGRPIPLVYGRHLVGGKVFFQHEIQTGADKGKTLLFVALGVGEWSSIEALFVNAKLVDHTDTSQFHFHPGKAGEAGSETDPATPNQKTCSFWPSNFTQQPNFPGIAYLSMKLEPDIEAPSAAFHVVAIYKTLLVRIFDNGGNQTSYVYSSNPAWVALDNHIRSWIAPDKLNGATLSTAEKDEIDFQAFKDWAGDCDFVTPQGTKRWEAHYALTEETDLMRALELDHLLGRAYTLEKNAKIAPFMDKVRSPVATVTAAHIADGSFNLGRRSLRDAANRIELKYRDLDSGKGAGSISTSGVNVTGTGTDFTKLYRPGEPSDLRDGAQAGQVRAVKSVASATSMVLKTAFSVDQTGAAYGNPAQDFTVKTHIEEDTTLQDQVGRPITATFDLGNSIPERAERIATFLLDRTTKLTRQTGYRLLLGQASALDHLPGDVLTSPDDVGFNPANTRDFEALELTVQPDGSAEVAGQEYQDIFSDAAAAPPTGETALPPRPRAGVAGGFQMGAVFAPDQLNGASNAGEIDFDPLPNQDHTFWRLPDGTLLSFPAGSQFVSQATLDSYTGDVFLIFSQQLCNSERGLAAFQDSHLLEVRHNAGQWQYDNNTIWVNFTPVASDLAIFRATRNGANWAGVPMEYLGVSLLSQRVLSTLVEYSDGTPIDDLQPDEANANVTESRTSNNTSNVGGSTAADTDTGASRARNALDSIFKLTTGTTLQTVAQLGDAHDRAVAGLDSTGDLARDIIASRKIVGRTEGLGTTLQHVNSTGLLDFSQAHPSKGALATLSAAAWGSQVSGRPTELTDGRVAAGFDAVGDLLRNVKTGRVIEASILAGALTLAKMGSTSLARMFFSNEKRTNVEALEASGLLATQKYHDSALRLLSTTQFVGSTSSGSFFTIGGYELKSGISPTFKGNLKLTALDLTWGPNNPSATPASSWVNPSNIFTSNNLDATWDIAPLSQTSRLRATGFGSAVAGNIKGIKVEIEQRSAFSNTIKLKSVRLVKNGVVQGTAKIPNTFVPSTDTYAVLGSSTDLWGATPTAADVNDALWGVEADWNNENASFSRTIEVDHYRMTIYTGGGTYVMEGRIKIGAKVSNVITLNSPTVTTNGAVTISDAGTGILQVDVQGRIASGAGTVEPDFTREDYTDQDESHVT